MKILLVEDEDDLRDALIGILQVKQQIQFQGVASGFAAIEKLKSGEHFDLIISDYNMPDGTGGDLLRYLCESKSRIPFVLCSSVAIEEIPEAKIYPIHGTVLKPDVFKPLLAILQRLMPVGEVIQDSANSQFFGVRLDLIARINPVCCPLYVQLSPLKFVKVLNAGDSFGNEELARFRDAKKLDSLYLRVSDCEVFVNLLAKNSIQVESFLDKLNNPKSIQQLADLVDDPSLKEDLSDIAMMLRVNDIVAPNSIITAEALVPFYNKALGHVRALGFTPEVVALVTANVNLALNLLTDTKALRESLRSLFEKKNGFESHSIGLAFLACSIASIMPWKSDAARHKLALAAFLHDLELLEESSREVEAPHCMDRLSAKDKRRLKAHPEKIVARLKTNECNFAINIEQILLQHHERPDGSGFPKKIKGAAIDPLAAVFIVAHDLLDYLDTGIGAQDIAGFLESKEHEYQVGHFQKIALAMHALEV